MNPTPEIILLSLIVIASLVTLWARFKVIYAAGSAVRRDSYESSEAEAVKYPKVSVIVYCFTDEEETREYLEMAMSQDYPDYEVVLVNEGGAKTTSELADRLLKLYPERLYVTFIPTDSRQRSPRKLAYTIGIKAAKGDFVVTTASNCTIPSERWLSELMLPAVSDDSTEVLLGYSHIDFHKLKGGGKWYRQMVATLSDCLWIGAAQAGNPYRGDGNNLAFRRQLFFDHKGYSNTMQMRNGDDDVFLRQFMDGYNTRTSISPDSILISEWGESSNRILADIKERYKSTQRFMPKIPFLRAGLGSLTQWVAFLAAVAAIAAGLILNPFLSFGYLFYPITALVLILSLFVTEITIYRRTARRLGSICLWWSLPWFLLWHPIGNAIFRFRRMSRHSLNRKRRKHSF